MATILSTRTGKRAAVKQSGAVLATVALFLLMAIALTSIASAIYVVTKHIRIERVLSDSMQPKFGRGDLLLVKAIDRTSLKPGDIPVLPILGEPGSQFAHRVISVERDGGRIAVRTKGDANPVADPWKLEITSKQVPLVVNAVPASFVPMFSLNRYALLGLFVLLCLLFIWLLTPSKMVQD